MAPLKAVWEWIQARAQGKVELRIPRGIARVCMFVSFVCVCICVWVWTVFSAPLTTELVYSADIYIVYSYADIYIYILSLIQIQFLCSHVWCVWAWEKFSNFEINEHFCSIPMMWIHQRKLSMTPYFDTTIWYLADRRKNNLVEKTKIVTWDRWFSIYLIWLLPPIITVYTQYTHLAHSTSGREQTRDNIGDTRDGSASQSSKLTTELLNGPSGTSDSISSIVCSPDRTNTEHIHNIYRTYI